MDTLNLKALYAETINTTAAALNLGMGFLEEQCRATMRLISILANERDIDLPHTINESEVADIMVALIKETEHPEKEEEQESEQDEQDEQQQQQQQEQ